MSTTPRLTKKYLLAAMRKQLTDRSFNRYQFQQQFGLADRKVRRYLNEIAEEFGKVTVEEMIILKKYCVDNLTEKAMARELDESTEAKIALSGESRLFEVKSEVTQTKNVNINVQSILSAYEHLFTEEPSKERTVSSDNST